VTLESLQSEAGRHQLELGEYQRRVEELESLFSNVAHPVFVTGLDGKIIDVNSAACLLLGYSKQELRLPAARDKHVGTFSNEALCGSQTDPAVSARNNGDLTL
jgi:PAS domain-containing protein